MSSFFLGELKSTLMKNVLNPLGRSDMHYHHKYKNTPINLTEEQIGEYAQPMKSKVIKRGTSIAINVIHK
jgi:hypothetical protein